MSLKFCVVLSAVILFLIVGSVFAEVPQMINYQGRLTDSGGSPLTGTYSIVFTVYDASSGGISKWTETHSSVIVSGGLFSVLLGSVNPISDTVFSGTTRYLGVKVGSDPEITPRTRISSVGYAMQAAKADTASIALATPSSGGWTDDDTTVTLTTETDIVRIGEEDPSEADMKVDIRGLAGAGAPMLQLYFKSSNIFDLLHPAMQIYNPSYDYYPFKLLGAGIIVQSNSSSKNRAGTIANYISPDPDEPTFFNAGPVGIGTEAPNPQAKLQVQNDEFETTAILGGDQSAVMGISPQPFLYAGYFEGRGYFQQELQVDDVIASNSGGFRFPDGSIQNTAAVAGGQGIPVGGIIMWSGNADEIPGGWKLCDGTEDAPDLRDRFITEKSGRTVFLRLAYIMRQ